MRDIGSTLPLNELDRQTLADAKNAHHSASGCVYVIGLLMGVGLIVTSPDRSTRIAGVTILLLTVVVGVCLHLGLHRSLKRSGHLKSIADDLAANEKVVGIGIIEAVVEDSEASTVWMHVRVDGSETLDVWSMGGRFAGKLPMEMQGTRIIVHYSPRARVLLFAEQDRSPEQVQ